MHVTGSKSIVSRNNISYFIIYRPLPFSSGVRILLKSDAKRSEELKLRASVKDPEYGEEEKMKAPKHAQADGLWCTWALKEPWCVCMFFRIASFTLTFTLESAAFPGNIIRVTPYYGFRMMQQKVLDKFEFNVEDIVSFYRQSPDRQGCK